MNEKDSKSFNIAVKKENFVTASDEIYINASPENVMKVLKNISNWPTWRKDIEYAKFLGGHDNEQDGSVFVWKANGLKYRSVIHTSSNYLFGWTGKTPGAFAIHNWEIIPKGEGSKVKVSESLEGIAIRFMRKKMKSELPKLLQKDLNELKVVSEMGNR
jgi:hypothetical protein